MKASRLFVASLAVCVPVAAWAQGPPIPQPGPEQEVLKRNVGVWDVSMEMSAPGMPPMNMTAVETDTLVGGLWLTSEFESQIMGQTIQGRSITGWDPAKKAYVTVRVDTMSLEMGHAEATYDADTETLKGWTELRNPMGGTDKANTEATWPDANTRVVKIFPPGGGNEPFMTLTYKKRP